MVGAESGAAQTQASGLRFRLLGPVEARRDGVPIELGPRKPRALLALLLLQANRVVPTELLIEGLWGESPPETARSALQVYVAALRKALGSDGVRLRTEPPGYILDLSRASLDLDEFNALRAAAEASPDGRRRAELLHDALALWRDRPLSEIRDEPFAPAAIARLEELQLAATEDRIDADLGLGRHRTLVAELAALIAEHPYRERLRAQLMLALYRSGRQSEALSAYQQARRTLREELGLEPGHELQQLERAILTHDRSLDAEPDSPTGAAAATAVAPATTPTATRRPQRGRRTLAILSLIVVAAAAVAVAAVFLVRSSPPPALAAIEPDSVGIVDPGANALVAAIPLHTKPAAIAYAGGSLWVATANDATLLQIDPHTQRVTRTTGLCAEPTALAASGRYLWALCANANTLFQVDALTGQLIRKIALGSKIRAGRFQGQPLPTLGLATPDPYAIAAAADAAWLGYGGGVVTRVDAKTGALEQIAAGSARGVTIGAGAVWTASGVGPSSNRAGLPDLRDAIWRINPNTHAATEVMPPPNDPAGGLGDGIIAGAGALWALNPVYHLILKIDPWAARVTDVIRFQPPRRPTATTIGIGAVWTANDDATVSRINPGTGAIVRTIPLGSHTHGALPVAITNGAGLLWIAVH